MKVNRIAIMQPYLFPYIGYFQLIFAVDKFIIYDDVGYIKNGWIHRNKILINKEAKYFTIPCKNVSSNKEIKDIEHNINHNISDKLLKKIKYSYNNAPYFNCVYNIIERVIKSEQYYVSDLAIKSIKEVSSYLDLNTIFKISSKCYENNHFKRTDRIIDICKQEQAGTYLNASGGKELYSKSYFNKQGIKLNFLEPNNIIYTQFDNKFVPGLSIIDIMMFNSVSQIKKMLNDYQLV
ncbi:MAG: WbqC family protein [Candidatus Paceibacterota bacterium]